jgi:UDP-glucose 4-epimerase
VTGTEGFIGGQITKSLNSSQYEIFTLDLLETSLEAPHFKINLTDQNLKEVVFQIRPEVVVHAAAQTDVLQSSLSIESDFQANALGTLRLVLASVESGVSNFCYINSGGAIYDQTSTLPVSEGASVRPLSPYGLSKYTGEEYLRIIAGNSKMHWSSLALSNCYGDIGLNKKGVIYKFWELMNSGVPPTIKGSDSTRDFIHVDDVINAVLCSIKDPSMQRVNISSASETKIEYIYSLIANLIGFNGKPNFEPANSIEIARSCLDNRLAKELWGWSPKIGIENGVRASIQGGK